MNSLKHGWFSEADTIYPGYCSSFKVDEILVDEKSKYQHILVFRSKQFGRVLVLDNAIQCTEFDEFSYQEMITFLPLNSHPNPRQVLVIGGGDGGVVREVVKHLSVDKVYQCEIDERVIEVSKEHLPFLAKGFSSPKLNLHIGDGSEFMRKHTNSFDVIITDSSDPVGPAEILFKKSYYEAMKQALRPNGIVCCQCESMWFNLDLIKGMVGFCRTLFPCVAYAYTTIPTYPGGHIGFLLCSLNPDTRFSDPVIKFTDDDIKKLNLRYYSREIHQMAFVLPQFVIKALKDAVDVDHEDGDQEAISN